MPLPLEETVDEDELCGCDADFRLADVLDDEFLPLSFGGVAVQGDGDEADGCDIYFGGGLTTADEDLPASAGGVE